ncbi:putative proline-rich receptor-like protein kinase PERK11 [Phragmites australis]|uniref:putative proline-rich receptor-like protein kinase PERK11 n=1 Tax=Phragmites australis TaxID=29695 RepID=UPI002D777535|nr:putative proline-rich receptor-like protein kinase PERK11 [Phragmites australis]
MATPATTLPPPPSESTTTSNPKQPPPPPPQAPSPPPSGAESDAPPKKRKLEEVGFHHSPYYKIRATVVNLRARFLQVCQASDPQKKDAALEILKEIKDVMELSKKMRLDLSSAAEPVKPFVKPAARASKDTPAGKIPSAEKNQVHPISLAGNIVHNTGGNAPLKPDNSEAAAPRLVLPVEIKKEARPSKVTNYTKQQGKLLQGSYVIGGSPIGWNFLMWPGSKAIYYGLTKAEWLAHQSAK